MRIAVTTRFIDKTTPDADPIEAGTTITVKPERGAELIAAGVGVEADAPAKKPDAA